MKRILSALAMCLLLAACGKVVVPAAGVTSTGERFRGTATASLQAGTFSVTGESGTVCSGTYDQFSTAKRLTIPVTCSNGLTATLELVRDNDLQNGTGTVVFSDGTTGEIEYGKRRVRS